MHDFLPCLFVDERENHKVPDDVRSQITYDIFKRGDCWPQTL
jgi:hypothetical protein